MAAPRNAPFGLAVLGLCLAACGGGSPSSSSTIPTPPTPTPTPPPVLGFVDGWTDAPLTPQSVEPASPRVGDSVRASLEGYWTREQRWDGSPIQLWPVADYQVDRHYRSLVYGGDEESPLKRWSSRRVLVVLGPVDPSWADLVPAIKTALQGVFDEFASAGAPRFEWADAPSGGLVVRVDPEDECVADRYLACTRWWQDGHTITRAELVYREAPHLTDDKISMQLLGFALGLDRWSITPSVMSGRYSTLHWLERSAIHMMYLHREPGNAYPDRDERFVRSAAQSVFERPYRRDAAIP